LSEGIRKPFRSENGKEKNHRKVAGKKSSKAEKKMREDFIGEIIQSNQNNSFVGK